MGLQDYFDNFASQPSRWADSNPDRCGCKGRGWWNSEVDTWHQCPHHGDGAVHPESDAAPERASYRLINPHDPDNFINFVVNGNVVMVESIRADSKATGWMFRPGARRVYRAHLQRGFVRK